MKDAGEITVPGKSVILAGAIFVSLVLIVNTLHKNILNKPRVNTIQDEKQALISCRENQGYRMASEPVSRGNTARIPAKKPATGNWLRPTPYDFIFQSASAISGVDVRLLKAVAMVESRMNPQCVSEKGAMGIMQLMPETARALGVNNPYDPGQNIHAGALYLGQQIRNFGNLDLALAAYNAGPNAVKEYGGVPPFSETINYIAKVKGYLEQSEK